MSTERFELIAPCHFGLEAVLKREILDLGYEISKVEDGKVTFLADAQGIADANVFLRTTERILLKIAEVKAETFDELFEATKALPWERYIPADGKFWIAKANSVKSKLFSPSDIQSIMKKAIVERLKGVYNVSWFPEDGASFPIRVSPDDREGTYYRDPCQRIDYVNSVEKGQKSCRSFLRKWYFSNRGGYDGCRYCTGYEPFFPCRGLEACCAEKMLV